ncbi:MAG: hypothetical protein NTW26_10475 [bacterium]|nr:hypothetical protein [bacterium]
MRKGLKIGLWVIILFAVATVATMVISSFNLLKLDNNTTYWLLLSFTAAVATAMGLLIGAQLEIQTEEYITSRTPHISLTFNQVVKWPGYVILGASEPTKDKIIKPKIFDPNHPGTGREVYNPDLESDTVNICFPAKLENHSLNTGFIKFTSIILLLAGDENNLEIQHSYILKCMKAHHGMNYKEDIPVQPNQTITTGFKFPFHYMKVNGEEMNNEIRQIDFKNLSIGDSKIPRIFFCLLAKSLPQNKKGFILCHSYYAFVLDGEFKFTRYALPPKIVTDEINRIIKRTDC